MPWNREGKWAGWPPWPPCVSIPALDQLEQPGFLLGLPTDTLAREDMWLAHLTLVQPQGHRRFQLPDPLGVLGVGLGDPSLAWTMARGLVL